ncbi:MAG: phosphopantetheine-binding protein [Ilumatobacter sp.]
MTITSSPETTPELKPVPEFAALIELLRAELHDVNPDIAIDLRTDGHLIDELGVDSLDLIEFVARIEYDHDVLVPDEDLDRLTSLDAIARYMIEALGGI